MRKTTVLEENFRTYINELYDKLTDPKYIELGAIFDIMAYTVIQQNLQ